MDDPQKAGIPIIAMTANAFSEDKQAALDAGMNDHIAKPDHLDIPVPTTHKNPFVGTESFARRIADRKKYTR